MNGIVGRIFLLIFVLALALPGAVGLLRPDVEILEEENRRATPIPALPASPFEVSAFVRQLDAYLSDHFGFRDAMIAQWRALRGSLNGVSGSSRVLAGDEGWLFLNIEQVVERSSGRLVIEGNAARILDVAEEVQSLAQSHGAAFAVLPAPNKHSVKSQFLPDFAQPAASARTELDQFFDLAKQAGMPTVDLRPVLKRASSRERPTYYRGDTHWNDYGAALAFDEGLKLWGLEKHLISPDARLLGFENRLRDGDLVRFADLEGVFSETVPMLDLTALGARPEGQLTALNDRDSQPGYSIDYGRDGPVVLVIGDSFTRNIFQPFWRHFAGKLYWMHHDNGNFDRGIFERAAPDLVLFQFVERVRF